MNTSAVLPQRGAPVTNRRPAFGSAPARQESAVPPDAPADDQASGAVAPARHKAGPAVQPAQDAAAVSDPLARRKAGPAVPLPRASAGPTVPLVRRKAGPAVPPAPETASPHGTPHGDQSCTCDSGPLSRYSRRVDLLLATRSGAATDARARGAAPSGGTAKGAAATGAAATDLPQRGRSVASEQRGWQAQAATGAAGAQGSLGARLRAALAESATRSAAQVPGLADGSTGAPDRPGLTLPPWPDAPVPWSASWEAQVRPAWWLGTHQRSSAASTFEGATVRIPRPRTGFWGPG
jgi:hypothetical protein